MIWSFWQSCVWSVKLVLSIAAFVASKYLSSTWRVLFPAISAAASLISIVYYYYLAYTAAGNKWLFWVTRVLGLLALIGDTLFLILNSIDERFALKIISALYFLCSTLEFLLTVRWTMRYWKAQDLPQTYDPICYGATGAQTVAEGNQTAVGDVATLYNKLLQERKPARDQQRQRLMGRRHGWKSSEVRRHSISKRFSLLIAMSAKRPDMLAAHLPSNAEIWARDPDHKTFVLRTKGAQLLPVLAYLGAISVTSAAYQIVVMQILKRRTLPCDWICVYNLTYVWLYLPWCLTLAVVIRRRTTLSRPILANYSGRYLLTTSFVAASLGWTLGICTTTLSLRYQIRHLPAKDWGGDLGLIVVGSVLTFIHGLWKLDYLLLAVQIYMPRWKVLADVWRW